MSGNDSGNGPGTCSPGHEATRVVEIAEFHGLQLLAAAQGVFWDVLDASAQHAAHDLTGGDAGPCSDPACPFARCSGAMYHGGEGGSR